MRTFATTNSAKSFGVAVDGAGNIFLTGIYSGTLDFDPTSPTLGKITALSGPFGHADAFLAKLDPTGTFAAGSSYVLSTGGQDAAINTGLGVAVTPDGTATFAGEFQHSMTLGSFTLAGGTRQDPFVARVDPTGHVLWAKDFNSNTTIPGQEASTVAVDALGNSYVAGTYYGTISPSAGISITSLNESGGGSSGDAFVAKLDSAGNVSYLRSFGGFGLDRARGIAADDVGNVTVIGTYTGTAAFVSEPSPPRSPAASSSLA